MIASGILVIVGQALPVASADAAFSANASGADTRPVLADSAAVSLPRTRRIGFVSKVNGHRYQITIAVPFTNPPSNGYPVLYVLDGYWYFASATEIVRLGFRDVVVVGIDYPEDSAYANIVRARRGPMPVSVSDLPLPQGVPFVERNFDLTLPATDAILAAEAFPGFPPDKSKNVGGVDDFLRTIELEVKPRVAALVPVDRTRQVFFGHSLGGLAALHALFTEPTAFSTFIIGSPSIWWGNREVLADETHFADGVRAGTCAPRVLITVGSEESTATPLPPEWGVDAGAEKKWFEMARMVGNARDLAQRLKALHGPPPYVVDFAIFENEEHGEAAWSALARGVPFAFRSRRN